MRFGIDFDNTIVCYDSLFHRVALEDGLIPASLPPNKSDVRNHLRQTGREEAWTELQGRVYGPRLAEAEPYPGVIDFFHACRDSGIPVFIISHKTRHPYLGERHDLHAAALEWLALHGFFEAPHVVLPRDHVFLELTKSAKIERIVQCRCSHFIDDLPEFLGEPSFPPAVERILFDPHDLYAKESRFHRAQSWVEIRRSLLPHAAGDRMQEDRDHSDRALAACPFGQDQQPPPTIGLFLEQFGIRGELAQEPLPGGANNRVRKITAGEASYVLKAYFHNQADARDRFGAERAFYEWAWSRGIRRIPEPLGWDASLRVGLFEFVSGRKLATHEIDEPAIDQASSFIRELNAAPRPGPGGTIPTASEACFSLREHLDCIEQRVRRLAEFEAVSDLDQQAGDFVSGRLVPAWRSIRSPIESQPGLEAPLPLSERCLSPSDFGFHNALLAGDGRLRFFDFEYAGWDDPAKLVCDFFCQPELPVPRRYWERWTAALGDSGPVAARAALLFPAYQIKWCCILLNEFLRRDLERREFAQGTDSAVARKERQLEKARRALGAIGEKPARTP